jgi:hypothetical protein
MNRLLQLLLMAVSLLLAWLWMQIVHELGHGAGAWLTGGVIERVVLHPLAISRTDVAPNPQPLIVVWAGPIVGTVAPAASWLVAAAARWRRAWLVRFFAGFCLLANGLYIGIGSWQGIGDAGDMLRHGSPVWTLWLFGLATAPAGLALWNGLGPHFGVASDAPPIDRPATYASLGLLVATAVAECLVSPMS